MEVTINTENKPKVIILLGGPASGKGTQAKVLAKRLNYQYMGTGDLLRAEIKKETESGKTFAKLMDKGELVPDELTDPLVKSRLEELKNSGIVLDGYPRNINQVKTLKEVFPDQNFLVLNVIVSAASLLARMTSRRVCDKCGKIFTVTGKDEKFCDACAGNLIQRSDDNPEVLTKRVKTYQDMVKPIIDYYRSIDKLVDIDGEPPIPQVTKNIEKVI